MSYLGSAYQAGQAVVSAVREVFSNPEYQRILTSRAIRAAAYRNAWQFYTNQAFEDLNIWSAYIQEKGLYEHTRLIYNPFRRLVDFYAGKVYPGRLSTDGMNFPDDKKLAIPFADDVDPAIRGAIGQLWQWSNFQTQKSLLVRFGAVAGSVMLEVIDEPETGRIRFETIWPSLVDTDWLELDAVGNVKQYALEYRVNTTGPVAGGNETGPQGQAYTYRKQVTPDEIKYFKDGAPFDYGSGSVGPNNYGFAPAVWIKHTDMGEYFGAGAFRGDFAKLDEMNSLATHMFDLIHKKIDPPLILWGAGIVPLLKNPQAQGDEAAAQGFDVRTDLSIWTGGQGGHLEPMVGDLNIDAAMLAFTNLQDEIKEDHPELTFYQKMREMSQVTGPAADRLVGDSQSYYDDACSNYDAGLEKLFAMGVAIGGMRVSEGLGGWTDKTEQQKKFQGFDLTSYQKDQLNVEIIQRPLLDLTEEDQIALQGKKLDLANKAGGIFPIDHQMELAGVADPALRKEKAAALAKEQGLNQPPNSGR